MSSIPAAHGLLNFAACKADAVAGKHADGPHVEALRIYAAELSRLEDENAKLREALEPFGGEFASTFVNDDGWTGPMSKTRIVDWFGPSDFRRAASLITKGGADV